MTRLHWYRAAGLAALALLAGCGFLPGGGGGSGGGGGGTGLDFTRGFAFVRRDDRNVYLADVRDTQEVARLTTVGGVRHPALSADGRTVVFAQTEGDVSRIATVPTAGGSVRTLVESTGFQRNFRTPAFSPAGDRVAFTFDEGAGVSSIGLVNADGTSFVKLIGGPLSYAFPQFTPDGLAVIAAAGSSAAQLTQLERVDLMTTLPSNLLNGLPADGAAPVTGILGRVALGPQGRQVVYDARVGTVSRVFLFDLDTRAAPVKLNEYVAESGTSDSSPCFVDAQTVAFSSDSGGNDNVYTVTTAGTGRRLVLPAALEPWFGP